MLTIISTANERGSLAGTFLQAVIVVCTLSGAQAVAGELSGCDAFAWSVAREKALFSAATLPQIASGAGLAGLPPTAFAVRLEPRRDSDPVPAPHGNPAKNRPFAAAVPIANVGNPGAYRVTLSDDVWIDVVQNGQTLPSTAHSGRHDCEGVRKTVQFDLQRGPAELRLSGASASTVHVAIVAADGT